MRSAGMAMIVAIAWSPCAAQATNVLAPKNDYLLRLSQEWGRNSALGDLAAAQFSSDDLEMRFWSGYGFEGTRGFILRRTASKWDGWSAEIVSCILHLPIGVGDTISQRSTEAYQERARAKCTLDPELHGSASMIQADTVGLYRVIQPNLDALWRSLVRAGIDSLPTDAPWSGMVDGYTYLVEVRRGDTYRASVIFHSSPPSSRADSMAERMARLVEPFSWGR